MIKMNSIMGSAFLKLNCLLFLLAVVACSDKPAGKSASEPLDSVSTDVATGKKTNTRTILFFGNSLTAGMGLDPERAFPALIQQKVDSLAMDYMVINSGLSGETTASGKNRLSWVLNQPIDIFVLELGANDGLRGISLDETRKNLQLIIDKVKEHNPEVVIVLAGMQIPPNMGIEYTKEFQRIFPDLAIKNDLPLIPFLLKDVAGIPELNQQDGIHPTEEGQKIVAENVWEVLKSTL
jgi:acyl-CoA thioesterase-1